MDKDFHIENERLYTSFETANICDLARTTLLKIDPRDYIFRWSIAIEK